MSIRDLRNQSGLIQQAVGEETVVLTSNGRPFALVIGMEEGADLVEMEAAIRRARAQLAVSRMRRKAAESGLDALSAEEIDAEICAARDERRGGA
jgi:prevent-host-death family protein